MPEDPRHLAVGSNSLLDERSTFSNYGSCVDLFAPGEHVIAPYAGGWLFVMAGTSVSAPLVVRQVSQTGPEPFDPRQARRELLTSLRYGSQLPVAAVPRDFFYAPSGFGSTSSALKIASGFSAPSRPMPFDFEHIFSTLRTMRSALRRP